MKRRIIAILCCFLIAINIVGAYEEKVKAEINNENIDFIEGNITEDTTLSGNKEYEIANDIQIKNGCSLTIEEGAVVNGNGYKISVYGKLEIDGAELKDANIYAKNTGNNPCEISISNTYMNGGSLLNPSGGADHAKITIIGNRFNNLSGYSYIWYPVGETIIERNLFEKCGGLSIGSRNNVYVKNNAFHGTTTKYAIKDWVQYDGSQCFVENNSFYDSGIVLQLEGKDSNMIAKKNYWGTTDLEEIQKRVLDGNVDYSIKNTIDFSEPLENKHEDTPDIPQETEEETQPTQTQNTPSISQIEYEKSLDFDGSYISGNSLVFEKDSVIIGNFEIEKDVYIKKGVTVTILNGYNVLFKKNVYVFGTLINNGSIQNEGTLNCLDYNGFITAGQNYGYGYFKNYGSVKGGTLNVKNDYIGIFIPEKPEPTPTPTLAPTLPPTQTAPPIKTQTPIPTETTKPTREPSKTDMPPITPTSSPIIEPEATIKGNADIDLEEEDKNDATTEESETESSDADEGKQKVAKIIVKKNSFFIKKGKKVKINAKKANGAKGKITYKSSKKKIATVNKNGVIKAKKRGRCYITVKCKNAKAKIFVAVLN